MPRKTSRNDNELLVYTDGGCIGNPGPGGWAAVLVRGGKVEELGGAEPDTTNNRMEMRGAIEGLRRAHLGESVHVVTDSRYLHDGITKWVHAWKRRGWRKADGQAVLNQDLWQQLDDLVNGPAGKVSWEHVRGHRGHLFNERCDAIANGFARGNPPLLRKGDGSWIGEIRSSTLEVVGLPVGVQPPVYLSLVDGELRLHPDWGECEAWVRGAKGARYKKIRSAEELGATLAAWRVPPEEAGRQLGAEAAR